MFKGRNDIEFYVFEICILLYNVLGIIFNIFIIIFVIIFRGIFRIKFIFWIIYIIIYIYFYFYSFLMKGGESYKKLDLFVNLVFRYYYYNRVSERIIDLFKDYSFSNLRFDEIIL